MSFYPNPFPELGEAEAAIDEAERKYAVALARLFPVGTRVRINHWRGSFPAEVIGIDSRERRLRVRNRMTGKDSYAYPGLRLGLDESDPPRVEKLEG